MLRNPIDRAISLYYERVYPSTQRLLSSLAPEELETLTASFVGSARGRWRDEGLGNSLCRMLCSASFRRGRLPMDQLVPKPLDLGLAQARLRRSLVGVVERMGDTWDILAHWAPWLSVDMAARATHRNRGFSDKETSATLPLPLLRVLARHNAMDLQLFAQGVEQFRRQMASMAGAQT